MTELSPAAQAVMDATDYPEDWATRIRVAAALRAVADRKAFRVLVEGHCRTIVDVGDIHAIAAELEAQ